MGYRFAMLFSIAVASAAAIGLVLQSTGEESGWGISGFADEIALLIAGPALAAFAGHRFKVNGKLLEAALAERAASPVPVPESTGIGVADPDAETPRLRKLALRSTVLAPLCLPLVAAGIYVIALPSIQSAGLLEHGNRVNGTVVDVPDRGYMWVEYWVRTERREVLIDKHYDHEYEPYQSVVVYYDPEDPDRARTDVESNTEDFGKAGVFLLAPGFVGFVCSVLSAKGWRHRHRLVTETGWRPAIATVKRDYTIGSGQQFEIHLVFEDGSQTVVRSAGWSVRSAIWYRSKPGTRVQVGGEGGDVVVLFPRGGLSGKPYVVPAGTTRDSDEARPKTKV
ncbi:DUF3592 domain-containing protein [Amycolatopsis sp. lyj-84]|uniref:DUF3592 domain-containing protein n=1 Tax=Amycolatopsis sp. lyj-84 TaxID=2789284 RepID=UPI00397DDBBD